MAVLSRPSLRSASRRKALSISTAKGNCGNCDDFKTADRDIATRSAKRPLELAGDPNDSKANKKPKSYSRSSTVIRPQVKVPVQGLPIRNRKPLVRSPVSLHVRPVHLSPPNNPGRATTKEPGQFAAKKTSDKRSLRSHDGTSRFKSELEQYFSNYEEMISIDHEEPKFLTSNTIIRIIPESSRSPSPLPRRKPGRPPSKHSLKARRAHCPHIRLWPDSIFETLTGAVRVTLPSLNQRQQQIIKDPLSDEMYLKPHAKEERKEKQLRNIEKDRAMHEKLQLECLLEGLRGHDWLRTMGISGITESEKKAYEPKRDRLIAEVRILLKKFRLWKEEEKRQKMERDDHEVQILEAESRNDDLHLTSEIYSFEPENLAPLIVQRHDRCLGTTRLANVDSSADDGDDDITDITQSTSRAFEAEYSTPSSSPSPPSSQSDEAPDHSDLDASAARQLHTEAILAAQAGSTQHLTPHRRLGTRSRRPTAKASPTHKSKVRLARRLRPINMPSRGRWPRNKSNSVETKRITTRGHKKYEVMPEAYVAPLKVSKVIRRRHEGV